MGWGLSEQVQDGGRARRRPRRRDDRRAARASPPTQPRGERVHELSLSSAIVNTVVKHADGRRVTRRQPARRAPAPGRPGDARVLLRVRRPRTRVCEGARLEQEVLDARLRCKPCDAEWAIEIPAFRCPSCGGSDVAIASGNEFEVESIEVEEAECIAPR